MVARAMFGPAASVTRPLGRMLGAGRCTVNQAPGGLQRDVVIRDVRARTTVVDRAALEQAACDC